ncbi:MAG: hypothetical protein GX615_10190, partial [Lentisphaerae bacterium]|nr:hypothetical protein [Lentisphaerota bacterium]
AIAVSARTGWGLDTLKRAIVAELRQSCRLWNLPAALSRNRLRGRREPALS